MLPEIQAGLCQANASRCTRKELDPKRIFQSEDPATDDGLGNCKPPRRGRQATGIGDLNERSKILELHCEYLAVINQERERDQAARFRSRQRLPIQARRTPVMLSLRRPL